jgi:hypothetical protein
MVDLALAHTARITQLFFAEFGTPADSLPYLPDLKMLGFSVALFVGESSGDASYQSRCPLPSTATEWDELVVEYICKTYHSFRAAAVVMKIVAYMK